MEPNGARAGSDAATGKRALTQVTFPRPGFRISGFHFSKSAIQDSVSLGPTLQKWSVTALAQEAMLQQVRHSGLTSVAKSGHFDLELLNLFRNRGVALAQEDMPKQVQRTKFGKRFTMVWNQTVVH